MSFGRLRGLILTMSFDFHEVLVVFGIFGIRFRWFLIFWVVVAVFVCFHSCFVVLVIYGNASGAPTPYHVPAVSIKSTTVPRGYPLPFSLIAIRFWLFLVVLVFDAHQILMVFCEFRWFWLFSYVFVVFHGFGHLW